VSARSSVVVIEDKLFNLPSPLQVSQLIKDSRVSYDPYLANPPARAGEYVSLFKRALNLGVYGTDLGYASIYEQHGEARSTLEAMQDLADQLQLSSNFSQQTVERLDKNQENRDSVLRITAELFQNVDGYLFENERNQEGVLVLAGGWVESLFLLTQSSQELGDSTLAQKIGEQKYTLDNLIALLRPHYQKGPPEFDALLMDLVDLAYVFEGVAIHYSYVEPIEDPIRKTTVVRGQTMTEISDYQYKTIAGLVKSIRDKIVE